MNTTTEVICTNEEKQALIKAWANDQKRRAFPGEYKTWGVWMTLPELDLTFYKYDLPDGNRIIAMEYLREAHYGEDVYGSDVPVKGVRYYLQLGKYYEPSSVQDYTIGDHLKRLKMKMQKELKDNA